MDNDAQAPATRAAMREGNESHPLRWTAWRRRKGWEGDTNACLTSIAVHNVEDAIESAEDSFDVAARGRGQKRWRWPITATRPEAVTKRRRRGRGNLCRRRDARDGRATHRQTFEVAFTLRPTPAAVTC